jgi:hypothetical protein
MSITWYTWLEQGRPARVSRQVLDSLARVLSLDAVEHRHLLELAGQTPPNEPPPAQVGPEVRDLLTLLEPNPAHVVTRCFDVVAWNAPVEALFAGLADRPEDERNAVWLMFHEPWMRSWLVEWEAEARWLVGLLRNEAGRQMDNPRYAELVGRLQETSAEFREFWDAHDVIPFTSSKRRVRHPVHGEMTLRYVKLTVEEDPDKSIIVHYPDASGEAARRDGAGPAPAR